MSEYLRGVEAGRNLTMQENAGLDAAHEKELAARDKEIAALKEEHTKIIKELNDLNLKFWRAENLLCDARGQIDALQSENQSLKAENEKLRAVVDAAEAIVEDHMAYRARKTCFCPLCKAWDELYPNGKPALDSCEKEKE